MERKEISELIVYARELEREKKEIVDKLILSLENNLYIFLDNYPCYIDEHADNLKDAILCYINYGETDLSCLLDTIEQALEEHPL